MIYSDEDEIEFLINRAGVDYNDTYYMPLIYPLTPPKAMYLTIIEVIEDDIDQFIGHPIRYLNVYKKDEFNRIYREYDIGRDTFIQRRNALIDVLYPAD